MNQQKIIEDEDKDDEEDEEEEEDSPLKLRKFLETQQGNLCIIGNDMQNAEH